MSNKKLTKPIPLYLILREILRHYLEFREHAGSTGDHVIEHGYTYYPEDGEPQKVSITISLWDLHRGIKELAPRKREALFYNVILDQRQRDVADTMGITTVSVGQYVKQACIQLARDYFKEEYIQERERSS